jgi:uncharacterized coiled-coil DUF342 family protein
MTDIYDDILWKLRIPLPYNLEGLTTKDLSMERREAANEIELLRNDLASCQRDLNYWYERCTRAEACANIMHNKINRKWWKKNAN